jgi:hypothetical protein
MVYKQIDQGANVLSCPDYSKCALALRFPRQSVARFQFDGYTLTLVTRMHGSVCRPVKDMRLIVEHSGRRRRRGLSVWWLKLEGVGWMYLSRSTSNAETLVRQLGP